MAIEKDPDADHWPELAPEDEAWPRGEVGPVRFRSAIRRQNRQGPGFALPAKAALEYARKLGRAGRIRPVPRGVLATSDAWDFGTYDFSGRGGRLAGISSESMRQPALTFFPPGLGAPGLGISLPTSQAARMQRQPTRDMRGRPEITREQIIDRMRRAGLQTELNELIKLLAYWGQKDREMRAEWARLKRGYKKAQAKCALLASAMHPLAVRVCRRTGDLDKRVRKAWKKIHAIGEELKRIRGRISQVEQELAR